MKARELSEFALQISLLLGSGITLESGFLIMAEDAETKRYKDLFTSMSVDLELGEPLDRVMKNTGEFPDYMTEMVSVGYETGTLEEVMKSLSEYYLREDRTAHAIKNALTYPIIMVFMLMVVLFVITGKVMPIFESVYKQLGTELSPLTRQAVQLGNIFSGVAIGAVAVLAIVVFITFLANKNKKNFAFSEKILKIVNEKSSIAKAVTKSRIASVMALSLRSGMRFEKGVDMAAKMTAHEKTKKLLETCRDDIEIGTNLTDALKDTGIFSNMDMQLIKVGTRAGKTELVFEEMAAKYEEAVNDAIDNFIARFEPTLVIVLAVVVGLILMAVMMPLVGMLASIGI